MGTPFVNHRRDRHEIRRVLAGLRVQCRNLSPSVCRDDLDFVGDRHRVRTFPFRSTDRSGY
jgi:hypothetical protein